jgi:hypothetical protein
MAGDMTRVSFGMIRPKFGNVKTEIDGLKFDSKREAKRWQELRVLERAGRIEKLQRQVKYRLEVNGVLIATYTADFVYDELVKGDPKPVVEDVKGWPNDRWPMKKKLMLACHGIAIREMK